MDSKLIATRRFFISATRGCKTAYAAHDVRRIWVNRYTDGNESAVLKTFRSNWLSLVLTRLFLRSNVHYTNAA